MRTAARNLLNNLLLSQWKCDVFIHFPISRSCWHKCFIVSCFHDWILSLTANSVVQRYTESVMIRWNHEGTYWPKLLVYICITARHTQNIRTNAILIQQKCPRRKKPAPGVYNSNRAIDGNEAPTYQLICGRPHS